VVHETGRKEEGTLNGAVIVKWCFELAGELGIDPGPRTLRELVWMVMARRKDTWGRLSSLMAHLANLQRADKKARVWLPDDFNPYAVPRPNYTKVAPKPFVFGMMAMMGGGKSTRPCPFKEQ
jgi:hypothetical protein